MMRINFRNIVIATLVIAVLILGFLFHIRKIWFVYPDKSVYSVDGLDVSHHQGNIDWEVVDKKYQFVFVKATEGDTFVDIRFDENVQGIKNTKRILGAYHFFHFNYGGLEQAHNFINTVGNTIDLPPVVDFEFTGNPDSFDTLKVTSELKICIDELEKYYEQKVILYVTHAAYKQFIDGNFDNPIWYRSIILPINRNIKNVLFWQYHNSAMVKGISKKVDLNVFKGTIGELTTLIMHQ